MNFIVFLLFTTIGSLIWNSVLVIVGAKVGSSWSKIVLYINTYSDIVLFLLIVMFVFVIFLYYRKGKRLQD